MIVCHCNRITSNDIDDAVCCLKNGCQSPDLCPESVYAELGACPQCCNCFPLAEKLIQESALRYVARADSDTGAGVAALAPTWKMPATADFQLEND